MPTRIALAFTIAAAALVVAGAAAQGQAMPGGAPRWEQAIVTVHVADEAAWAGTDVAGALAQWSPAMALVLTTDTDADVTLTSATSATLEGGTAYRAGEGSTITSCRVELAPRYAGTDNGATLAHEIGHCLGLSHNNMGEVSVMYWIQGGAQSSQTVTATDLTNVRALHR